MTEPPSPAAPPGPASPVTTPPLPSRPRRSRSFPPVPDRMKRALAVLLLPYFAPPVALSLVAFAAMLATPAGPGDGTGPSGSDALGLYFIGVSVCWGGVLQLLVGLPFHALISRLNRFESRLATGLAGAAIPVALSLSLVIEPSSSWLEAALVGGGAASVFGLGAWLAVRFHGRTPPLPAGPNAFASGPGRGAGDDAPLP